MIDLYSDTLTKPTSAMRQAMANADVGDEQRREDPTTSNLQQRVAQLLGKEAAMFLPSGAMCNAIAIKTHTQPARKATPAELDAVAAFQKAMLFTSDAMRTYASGGGAPGLPPGNTDAEKRGLLTLRPDEKSGGYTVRLVDKPPAKAG